MALINSWNESRDDGIISDDVPSARAGTSSPTARDKRVLIVMHAAKACDRFSTDVTMTRSNAMKLLRNVSFALSGGALAAALSVAMVSPAHADTPLSQATAQYAGMCANQATNIPAPHGEGDLKGNPKLGEYCQCFGAKFAARALASVQDGGKSSSVGETVKEEQAMRNSCRKQVGLPLLKF